jgi:hypothetical protein
MARDKQNDDMQSRGPKASGIDDEATMWNERNRTEEFKLGARGGRKFQTGRFQEANTNPDLDDVTQ